MNTQLLKAALVSIGLAATNLSANAVSAQVVLPPVVTGEELSGMKGSTVNRSSQSGSKSSVSFGSSTTFGASSSLSTTSGSFGSAESSMQFHTSGRTDSTCSTGGCIGSSIGGTTGTVNADISNLRSTTEAGQNSSGTVTLQGIAASNEFVLSPDSSFKSNVSTVHADTGVNTNGSIVPTTPVVINETQNASATSSTLINTNTNVDINTTEFISSFQQAF